MNEEVDSTAIINEIIGPDEEEQEAAFEINRRKLNEARQKRNEGRAQRQLEAVNKLIPEFTVADISEGLSDMKATQTGAMLGGSIVGEYLPLPKGIGSVAGAGTALAAKKLIIDPIVDEVFNTTRSIFNIAKEAPSGRMFGVTAGGEGIKGGGKYVNPTKKNLEYFNKIGFTGTNKLDIQTMLYGIDDAGKPAMSQYKRRAIKAGLANETFDWGQFNKTREVLVKDYLDGLQDLKIDPKTIHAHHISALRVTASLFDGLSPIQRKKLLKTFQKEGLALGNSPKNLMALHKSVHLDVVHPFLEKQLGKYGQLLLDPAKMKRLNPRQREGLVKKFANIIRHSEEVALEASRTWLDDVVTGATPDQALSVKLDMLDEAFEERLKGLRLLKNKLDNIGPYLPYMSEDAPIPELIKRRARKKDGKKLLDRLLEPYDKDQLTIWDIDPETFSKRDSI